MDIIVAYSPHRTQLILVGDEVEWRVIKGSVTQVVDYIEALCSRHDFFRIIVETAGAYAPAPGLAVYAELRWRLEAGSFAGTHPPILIGKQSILVTPVEVLSA